MHARLHTYIRARTRILHPDTTGESGESAVTVFVGGEVGSVFAGTKDVLPIRRPTRRLLTLGLHHVVPQSLTRRRVS